MNYSNPNEVEKELRSVFPDVEPIMKYIDLGGRIPVFLMKFKSEGVLQKSWEKITEYIACNYQANLSTEFETWNIYLFFLSDKHIDKSLKYKIEKDTFSSRKIVIDYPQNTEHIVTENILNNDLRVTKIDLTNKGEAIFTKNNIIWNALNGRTVKNIRLRPEVAEDVLEEISNSLKSMPNEDKKS